MLEKYLAELQETLNKEDAREESYYVHLEGLIRDFAEANQIKNIDITILPKKTEAGNPDFRIWDGKFHITGYIEAKDPSVSNLDKIEETEQLKRYRATFPNIILTNFYEFRLYRNGDLIKSVSIGRPFVATKLKTPPPVENEAEFYDLLNAFFSFSLPQVRSAKSLATELAKRTRFLRDEVISIELAEEEKQGRKAILGFYEAFKKYLIGTLTKETFADLYSQTITYGLFAARTRSNDSFNRELAFKYIPNTIGILKDVFHFISLGKPPKSLEMIVDDIAEVLSVTDVNKILHEYYQEGKGLDPIIHFYETFLSEYDPSIREKRGVYYTPEPVVSYIVRSVHQILKTHFEIPDGLASENVTLLDPAGGTLTFPAEAVKVAVEEYVGKYGQGGKQKFIKNHILQNFYAFELMMAPYAIGHIKMSFLLEELGYRLSNEERFKLYLTNALEMEELEQIEVPGLSSLSEESHLANKIKKEQPILVIIGNPPYSGHSANQNGWTEKLLKENLDGLQSYYVVDNEPLGEKNPKWLQDDYVKFLRFAQWKINKAGAGIVGMITNHSYLDNPTFRGMRQSLMKTFNEIYILDLHGNSLKKETCPDGSKDENVFDIRQGTAIAIFIKLKEKEDCKVYHNDLYGLREAKYNWLKSNRAIPNNYKLIKPEAPFYFFTQRRTESIKGYLKWKSVTEIFPVYSVGIVTARDNLTIHWSENDVWNTVLRFSKMKPELARKAFKLGPDARDWKVRLAQEDLLKSGPDKQNIKPILYRPFDIRFTYYTGKSRGFHCRPRPEVMQHMLMGNNLGLITIRRSRSPEQWNYAFITNKIIAGATAISSLDINYLFPLYTYIKTEKPKKKTVKLSSWIIFEPKVDYIATRNPNISKEIWDKLNQIYGYLVAPEDILYYIYAILYSNSYRSKYTEFLKIDFPRIPFTSDYNVFTSLSSLGSQLVELHLLESRMLEYPVSKFQGESQNDKIEKVEYNQKEKRIYINNDKYFDNVTSELWNYHIGGYQVLHKYLKERKERTIDDPRHLCRVVTALSKTIEIQKQIDEIYPKVENELIEF